MENSQSHLDENGRGLEPMQGNGDPNDDQEIVPMDLFNADEGKLQASVSWLIAKVYENNVPDVLLNPFYRDANNQLHTKPTSLQQLTSGELYCLAASRIFHDSGFLNQNHSAVLQALHRYSIEVQDEDQEVTETTLSQTAPFKMGAHLAMIDGLMTAHMRQVITVERVVDSVRKYTTVQQNEAPYDVEDSLLFWINKICATVRDNLEKRQRHAPGMEIPVVPEMEDLYEDMCDGICIATLLSFYRPDKLRQQSICFNDQMSIADCVYNLRLQQDFCRQWLPWNAFHFQIEDILYLHESLRPNVNAFLADLFQFFERESNEPKGSAGTPQGFSSARRTLERVGIPDLRGRDAGGSGSGNKLHPTFSRLKQSGKPIGSGATSLMNSTDSLMTQRSSDSLKYRPYKGASTGIDGVRKSPTTTFGEIRGPSPSSAMTWNKNPSMSKSTSVMTSSPYSRADTMPAGSPAVSQASIRLALEEKKRQYEAQRMQGNAQKQIERQEMGKEAFFTLMGKPLSQGAASKLIHPQNGGSPSSLRHATSGGGRRSQDDGEMAELNKNVQVLQQEIKRLSVEQGRMKQMVENPPPSNNLGHAMSQPLVYAASTPHGLQNLGTGTPLAIYATPQGGAFVGAAPGTSFGSPNYAAGSPPVTVSGFLNSNSVMGLNSNQNDGTGTFRLHSETEPASRLDPSLELNRNLTNWGMTYKAGAVKQSRKTWDNSTFVKEQQRLEEEAQRYRDEVPQGMVPIAAIEPQQQLGRQPSYTSSQGNRPPSYPGSNPFQIGDQERNERLEIGQLEMNFGDVGRRTDQQRFSTGGSSIGALSPSGNGYPPLGAVGTFGGTPNSHANTLAAPVSESGGSRSSESPKSGLGMVGNQGRSSTDGREQSPGIGFVVGEGSTSAEQKRLEMEQRREQLMANALRRREEVDQKRERAEREAVRKREAELKKQEDAEKRKIEKEIHRQKVLEDYQRKKAEQEAKEHQLHSGAGTFSPNSSSSAATSTASTPRAQRLARGHSQPPRPKSQHVGSRGRLDAVEAAGVAGSASSDNLKQLSQAVPIYAAEPALKLFVKPSQKSNRNMVYNSLQYSVLAGAVHNELRSKVLEEFAKSESKHFLLLFRDIKCQYRGLYTWDEQSDTVHKLHGQGPKLINEKMMDLMFKYDSGGKQFSNIPTRHLSATIDGFSIKDEYWQKKKPLYAKK